MEDLIKKLNERGTKVKIVKEDEASQSTPIQKQKKTDEAPPSVKKSTNSVTKQKASEAAEAAPVAV